MVNDTKYTTNLTPLLPQLAYCVGLTSPTSAQLELDIDNPPIIQQAVNHHGVQVQRHRGVQDSHAGDQCVPHDAHVAQVAVGPEAQGQFGQGRLFNVAAW